MFAKEYFIKIQQNTDINILFKELERIVKNEGGSYKVSSKKAFQSLREQGLDRIYVVDIPDNTRSETLKKIQSLKGIEYLELVPEYKLFYTPNDYNGTVMWNLNKISATQAWDIEKGGKGIVVALVDDGMDTSHPDLQPALWHNINEIKGNAIDDDGNGFVDDFFGWDVADNDNIPHVTPANNLTHGTHCAGTIGARTDNGTGISGIGFNVKIMPVKCGRNGQGTIYNAYSGVEYAIENKARVISMSWGGYGYSRTFQTLFDVAHSNNIVCVAAAANDNTDAKAYPAAYNHVIAVGNTDNNDAKHWSSNYGTWVDVMAPGSNIYSTLPGNTYGYKTGTSMACPLVAGLCALMISKNPYISNDDVESCLKSACDNINNQNTGYISKIGAGRINAYNALKCVKPVIAMFTSSKRNVCTGDTMKYYDQSLPSATSWEWNFEGGTPSISSLKNPVIRYNTPGVYKVKLIAMNSAGADTMDALSYVKVGKPTVKFSGNQNILKGEYGTIKADFTGWAPWTLIYTDGKKKDTVKNIMSNPYFILKIPDSSVVYKPLSIQSGSCSGTVSDSAIIKVDPTGANVCDSAYRFQFTFGGNGNDQGWDIEVVHDSIIYIAGRTTSGSVGNYDAFLAKVTSSGRFLWMQTVGGGNEDGFYTLTVDNNENIYCGGYTNSDVSGRAAVMIKFNKSGIIKWKKYYHGSTNEFIFKTALSRNQDFVYFTGHSTYGGFGSTDYTVYKLDTLGNVRYAKQFGVTDQDRPYTLMPDDSGNLYIAGFSTTSRIHAHVMKLDSNGAIKFSKLHVNTTNNNWEYTSIVAWDKLTFYLVGRHYPPGGTRTILTKMNVNGNVIWSKEIMSGTSQIWPKISILNNKLLLNDYVLSNGKTSGLMYYLDSSGNLLSSRQISAAGDIMFPELFPNKDGGVYYVGTQYTSSNEILIGRTNCQLNNPCATSAIPINITNFTVTTSNQTFASKNFTNTATPNHNAASKNYNTSFSCKTVVQSPPKKCKLNTDFSFNFPCAGDTALFISKSIDSNGYTIDGWFWDFGDGAVWSGSSTARHAYSKIAAGYNVRLIVKSTKGNAMCADTVQKTFQSTNVFKVVMMPSEPQICIGDSITVAVPVTGCGVPPYTYKWTPNTGVNDATMAQPYFSPKSTTLYTVEITDSKGKKAQADLKVNVDITCCKSVARFAMNKPELCKGDTIYFTNMSTFEPSSIYFKWVFTGANIASYVGQNPPGVIFNSSGKQTVSLILADMCSTDTQQMELLVHALPMAYAGKDTLVCRKDTLQLGEVALGRNIFSWSPVSGLNDALRADPEAIVSADIDYIVNVTDEYGCMNSDTVKIGYKPETLFIRNDTSICNTDSVLLNIPAIGKYLWSTTETTQSIYVKDAGIYWGQVTNRCIARDTVQITMKPVPFFELGPDTFYCKGNPFDLTAPTPASYLWSTGSNSPSITVTQTGIYWLRTELGGCYHRDTIYVEEKPLPVFNLGADVRICKDSVVLTPSLQYPGASYTWNTGASAQTIKTKTPGKYTLRITDQFNCSFYDSVNTTQGILPEIHVEDIVKCEGLRYSLKIGQITGHSYMWYDSTTGIEKLFSKPGNYWIRARTECGDSVAAFKVIDSACSCNVWVPEAFSPSNKDGKNDNFFIVTECPLVEYKLKIFDRWGEIVFQSDDYTAVWNGEYKNDLVPLGMYLFMAEFRKDMPGYKEYNLLSGMVIVIE